MQYDRTTMPCYPHQITNMDITGSTCSERGHVYLFKLIDNFTCQVDAHPIVHKKTKTTANSLIGSSVTGYTPFQML